MIQLRSITMKFGNLIVFDGLTIAFDRGQLNFVTGESGSGKTTLLNILAGYQQPTSGTVTIDGNIATIFQNYELIDELTIKENILLGQRRFTKSQYALIKRLGLSTLLHFYPNELSGGQRQRVGIARALLQKPDIILCDEPTESLDYANKDIVMDLLSSLSVNTIVIIATHDQRILDRYPGNRYHLENHTLTFHETPPMNTMVKPLKLRRVKPRIIPLIHQLYFIKTVGFTLLSSLIFIFLLLAFHGYHHFFYIPSTTKAVDAMTIYFRTNNINMARIITQNPYAKKIMDMRYVSIDGQYYSLMPKPFQSNTDLTMEGSLNGMDMVVNQNCNSYNVSIGSTIEVVVSYKTDQSTIPVKITGIVDEPDRYGCSIYYDLDQWNTYYQDLEETQPHRFQDIDGASFWYMSNVDYDQLPIIYQNALDSQLQVVSPLYDQRILQYQQSISWSILFQIITGICMLLFMVWTIFYTYREGKYLLKQSCILAANGIDLSRLRLGYGLMKGVFGITILILGLTIPLTYPTDQLKWFMFSYTQIAYGLTIVTLLLYLSIMFYNLFSIRNKAIADILKQD